MNAYELLLQIWQRFADAVEGLDDVPFLNAGKPNVVELTESWHNLYLLGGLLLEEIEAAQHKHWLDAAVYLFRCSNNRITRANETKAHDGT